MEAQSEQPQPVAGVFDEGAPPLRVCFVALNALPAIDPEIRGPIGGVETRSWMLARGLATRPGFEVRFAVRHHRPLKRGDYERVRLVPLIERLYPVWREVGHAVEKRAGFPWLRIKRWSPKLLWQLPIVAVDQLLHAGRPRYLGVDRRLTETAADVYCTFGVQTHSAAVIASAHAIGKPAVLFLGSDGDLDPVFVAGEEKRDPYGTRARVGRRILQEADLILAQTDSQRMTLHERFGLDSVVLPNPIDVEQWDARMRTPLPVDATGGLERYLLWVGRAEELHKRPQLCLELARRCPEAKFLMVMNPRDPEVEARIHQEAPPNVRILDHVPFHQMPGVFARAAGLVNTSQLEGFPNVFLQAAVSGVPVLSLEVGDAFLRESGAGECLGGDLSRMADRAASVWKGAEADDDGRAFVVARHGLASVIDRLETMLAAQKGRGLVGRG